MYNLFKIKISVIVLFCLFINYNIGYSQSKTIVTGQFADRPGDTIYWNQMSPTYFFENRDVTSGKVVLDNSGRFRIELNLKRGPSEFSFSFPDKKKINMFLEPGQEISLKGDAGKLDELKFSSHDISALNNDAILKAPLNIADNLELIEKIRTANADNAKDLTLLIDKISNEIMNYWNKN